VTRCLEGLDKQRARAGRTAVVPTGQRDNRLDQSYVVEEMRMLAVTWANYAGLSRRLRGT
jgi:hypothetical protein